MAQFTEAEAEASKLQSANKEFIDGSFGYWVLRVSGSDGQYHQFVDHNLAAGANVAAIKAQLVGHLTGSEYFVAPTPPVVSGSVHYASNVGDTLG